MFYAIYKPKERSLLYNEMERGVIHAFLTEVERDDWIDSNDIMLGGNIMIRPINRRDIIKIIGGDKEALYRAYKAGYYVCHFPHKAIGVGEEFKIAIMSK